MVRKSRKAKSPIFSSEAEKVKAQTQLLSTSCPGRLPQCHFFLRYPADAKPGEGRQISFSFPSLYGGQIFLEAIMNGEDVKWLDLASFIVPSKNLKVHCTPPTTRDQENDIERALNHKATSQEKSIVPEDHFDGIYEHKTLRYFLRTWPDEITTINRQSAKRTSSPSRKSLRPDGDYVSVTDMSEELGIAPRDARAALRKAAFQKPSYGWSFERDSDDYNQVRKIIEGARK